MLSKAVGLSSANSAQSTSLCQALSTACYSHHLTQPCTLVINISRAVTKTLRSREVRWSHLGLTSRIHILLSNSEACAPGPLWPWRQPPPLLQPSSLPPHPPSWGKYVLSVLPLSPKPSHPDSLGVACLMCGVLILACWHLLSCPWNSILTPVRNHFSPPHHSAHEPQAARSQCFPCVSCEVTYLWVLLLRPWSAPSLLLPPSLPSGPCSLGAPPLSWALFSLPCSWSALNTGQVSDGSGSSFHRYILTSPLLGAPCIMGLVLSFSCPPSKPLLGSFSKYWPWEPPCQWLWPPLYFKDFWSSLLGNSSLLKLAPSLRPSTPCPSWNYSPMNSHFLCPWDSPGKHTAVGSHPLLQGIFPTQGLNLGLLHCRQILYHLSHQGSPSRPKTLCHLSLKS